MKKFKLLIIILLLIAISFMYAKKQKTISKVFEGKKIIKIYTISADCVIEKSNDTKIYLDITYTYDAKKYTPAFIEKSNYLKLKEKFNGSSKGKSLWNLKIPENSEVIFNSASGDLEISNLSLNIDSNTASGDFDLKDIIGKIDISTASGDMKLYDFKGNLSFDSASGNLQIKNMEGNITYSTASGDTKANKIIGNIKIKSASGDLVINGTKGAINAKTASGEIIINKVLFNGDSTFKSASGDISISLSGKNNHNLAISTASGDVELDFKGNKIHGYFELITKKSNSDDIYSPFEFENSEIYKEWGKNMVKKTIILENKTPKTKISSYSGSIKIKN